jgi:uncharacterized protein YndB with AHSA1/START domain
MKKTEKPIVVKQKYQSNVESIWDAITRVEKMRMWLFEQIESFEPEVGFETQFDVRVNNTIFPHYWKVIEVENQKKIGYKWEYPGFRGKGMVLFELKQISGKAKLTVTFTTVDDFTDDIPEFRRESCQAGWEYFIQKSLKEFLDG